MDPTVMLFIYLVTIAALVGLGFIFLSRSGDASMGAAAGAGGSTAFDASSTAGDRKEGGAARKRRGGMDRMRRGAAALDEGSPAPPGLWLGHLSRARCSRSSNQFMADNGDSHDEDKEEQEGPVLSKKEQRKKDKKDAKDEARQVPESWTPTYQWPKCAVS